MSDDEVIEDREKFLDARAKEYETRSYIMRALFHGMRAIPPHLRTIIQGRLHEAGETKLPLQGYLPFTTLLTQPESGFFHVVDFSAVAPMFARLNPSYSAEENFTRYMAESGNVLTLPGYAMYWPGKEQTVMRMSYAPNPKELVEGVRRIHDGVKRVQAMSAEKGGWER